MAIFNSLGSNYNFRFVLNALFTRDEEQYRARLIKFLEEKYNGQVFLTYKGREALRLALRGINKQRDYVVGICGYTCYAVYEAIAQEGYELCFHDLNHNHTHFSFETLEKNYQENPKMKILIIQNTLGYPCEMGKIAKFCKEKGIILIEDLAHSIGTTYADGKQAGTVGDFVILSFSQDKMIDAVSGGGLIIRNQEFKQNVNTRHSGDERSEDSRINSGLDSRQDGYQTVTRQARMTRARQFIDRLYPLLTFLIRKTYAVGVGKLLHAFFKTFHLLSNPMSESKHIQALPSWYCSLIYGEFESLEKNLAHRRKIAGIYVETLDKKILAKSLVRDFSLSTNLRFPVFVENRQSFISYLKKHNIYVSDIWYDAPIAPKKYLHLTNYAGQCPNAEKVSSRMVNLPTHRNVSEEDAGFIARTINEWLK